MTKETHTYKHSVVKIINNCVDIDIKKPYGRHFREPVCGSGFFVNINNEKEPYIITCCHVVDNAINLDIQFSGETSIKYPATVISLFPEHDIALMKVTNYEEVNAKNNIKCMQLLSYRLNLEDFYNFITPLENATAIGFPLASDTISMTTGRISRWEDYKIQHTTVINGGNSGGPLIIH